LIDSKNQSIFRIAGKAEPLKEITMGTSRNSTIVDVAKLAGVSVSTVSVVMNNKDKYVAPELREKVLNAIAQLNYAPNFIARSLKSNATNTIGLILTNITSPVTPAMVRTVQKAASEQHMDTLIISTEENDQIEINAVNNLISKRVDGLIICPVLSKNYDHLYFVKKETDIPIVCIERTLPTPLEIASVTTNNYEISKEAVNHLIEHGRKRIALIALPKYGSNTIDRIRGYEDALKENNLYIPELIKETDYMGTDAFEIAHQLIEKQKIDAIFCISQSITLGVYKAAMHYHYKIPEEIAIIGYDTVDWMEVTPVKITTIRQPLIKIAQTAINLLFMMKQNPNMNVNHSIIPSELIIRQSCGCSSDDPLQQ
jgi:LacI family transcriptional regulator